MGAEHHEANNQHAGYAVRKEQPHGNRGMHGAVLLSLSEADLWMMRKPGVSSFPRATPEPAAALLATASITLCSKLGRGLGLKAAPGVNIPAAAAWSMAADPAAQAADSVAHVEGAAVAVAAPTPAAAACAAAGALPLLSCKLPASTSLPWAQLLTVASNSQAPAWSMCAEV